MGRNVRKLEGWALGDERVALGPVADTVVLADEGDSRVLGPGVGLPAAVLAAMGVLAVALHWRDSC